MDKRTLAKERATLRFVLMSIQEFVNRTKSTRGNYTQLLLRYCKPVSTDTIACWHKKVLENAVLILIGTVHTAPEQQGG